MISSSQIQNAYINLYKEIRNYIWGYNVVEHIAELEIEVFKRCPDIMLVGTYLDRLNYDMKRVCKDDEYLQSAFEDFKDLIGDNETTFYKLNKVDEVI